MERERQEQLGTEDGEKFRRVWQRVATADSPVVPREKTEKFSTSSEEPVETPRPAQTVPEEILCPKGLCFHGGAPDSRALQSLVLEMVIAAADYRELLRRSGRERQALLTLEKRKLRHGQRLSAAYFLMTGVRYWPTSSVPISPPEGFLPELRLRFLAEQKLARTLKSLGESTGDRCLRELYLSLAEETEELSDRIYQIVEQQIGS